MKTEFKTMNFRECKLPDGSMGWSGFRTTLIDHIARISYNELFETHTVEFSCHCPIAVKNLMQIVAFLNQLNETKKEKEPKE